MLLLDVGIIGKRFFDIISVKCVFSLLILKINKRKNAKENEKKSISYNSFIVRHQRDYVKLHIDFISCFLQSAQLDVDVCLHFLEQ